MILKNFNPSQYENILKAATGSGRTIFSVGDFIAGKERAGKWGLDKPYIIIRHDVDDDVRYALEMAEMEKGFGIRSTYYIRRNPKVWLPATIVKIASMGHEIGYHYECLSKTDGDVRKAAALFKNELEELRSVSNSEVSTCCMHGDVLSEWDNRDLWKHVPLQSFGLSGEAYLSLAGMDIAYFSDSGYTWSRDFCVYDRFDGINPAIDITGELIEKIADHNMPRLCLLTHPILWMGSARHRQKQAMREYLLRIPKRVLIRLRHPGAGR